MTTFFSRSIPQEQNGKYIFLKTEKKLTLSCNYCMGPLDLFINLRYIILFQNSRNYVIITHVGRSHML